MNTCAPAAQLKILIVDDEPLARHWLRMQLHKCELPIEVSEAASAALAHEWLCAHECHLILLDIHMPGVNGLEFAEQCQKTSPAQTMHPPAVIFVTADSSHALQAFELAAFDYLTKPVSVERLKQALQRVSERTHFNTQQTTSATEQSEPSLTIDGVQHISRVALSKILYFQADSKYVKVVTDAEDYLIENSLNALEEQFKDHVIRAHRAYLVPRHAIEKLIRVPAENNTQEMWAIKIHGSQTLIPVSRRQLGPVKELLHNQ